MSKPFLASMLHDLRRLTESIDDGRQTDQQLLERFLSRRDEASFAVLVRRHSCLVLSACRRVLSDEADVEDAFQATFLVLLRRVSSVRWRASIGNWLFGVAHRIAVRARANAARRQCHEAKASRERQRSEEPSAELSWREAVAVLHEELDRLPDALRLPLLLCYLDGKTRDEAAQALGCSAGAVKGRLERGRERLRLRLIRRGLTLSGTLLAALIDPPTATSLPPSSLIQSTLLAARSGQYSRSVAALIQAATASIVTGKMRMAVGLLLTVSLLAVGGNRAFTPRRGDPAPEPPAERSQPNRASAKLVEQASASITLRGRVLGPDDKPVAGAQLYSPRWQKERRQNENEVTVIQRGTTDARGRFRLQLPHTEIKAGKPNPLLAVADGFGLAWVEWMPEAPPAELTLRLVKDVPIRGRLLSTEGKPIAGVTVTVVGLMAFERLDDFLRVFQRETKHVDEGTGARRLNLPLNDVLHIQPTDKDGRFEIKGVGVERLAGLAVKSAGVSPSGMLVVTRANFDDKAYLKGALRPKDERMPPLFGPSFEHVMERAEARRPLVIEGIVREAGSGKPVVGATVSAAGVTAVTDARGHYRLTGMRTGQKQLEYSLQVSAPESLPLIGRGQRVKVTTAANEEPSHADFELMRGVVVRGRVYDKATGKGVANCSILGIPLPENKTTKTEGLALNARSGEDGRFRLLTIPGPIVLLAQAGWAFKIDGVPITPYKLAEFDAADRPRVKMAEQQKLYRAFLAVGGTVDLDLFHACKVLDIKEDGAPVSCDLVLDPGKTLKVQLQDGEGKPLAGAVVSGISSWTKRAAPLKTADCRIYALDPEKPRPVAFLHAERKLAAFVTLRGDEKEPVTVRLTPTGILTGRVLDADGQPIAGADVYTFYATAAGGPLLESQMRMALPRTDKEGRFRVDAIVPGLEVKDLRFLKGRRQLVPQTRLQIKPLESGQTRDLGDVRVKPRP